MLAKYRSGSSLVLRQWLVLIILAAVCIGLALSANATEAAATVQNPMAIAAARQEIEYLRRHYARATDLIGQNTPASIAEGRAIYHRIFTPDAEITVTIKGQETLSSKGPDEWVQVVVGALSTSFTATQHLIGTQIVDIKSLPAEGASATGEASMTSYLQAWHDGKDIVDMFMGTYTDQVRYTPQAGWQIYRMNLDQTAHEVRKR